MVWGVRRHGGKAHGEVDCGWQFATAPAEQGTRRQEVVDSGQQHLMQLQEKVVPGEALHRSGNQWRTHGQLSKAGLSEGQLPERGQLQSERSRAGKLENMSAQWQVYHCNTRERLVSAQVPSPRELEHCTNAELEKNYQQQHIG